MVKKRKRPRPLSKAAEAARRPPPPERLVGALQDRIHATSGKWRAVKAVRVVGWTQPVSGWWATANEDGSSLFVGGQRDKYYDARAEGCRRLGDALARYVSIDAIAMHWVDEESGE